jgi:hypothetical protein
MRLKRNILPEALSKREIGFKNYLLLDNLEAVNGYTFAVLLK